MDLLCTEQDLPSPLTAYQDPTVLDDAALEQLLHSEEKYQPSTTYFQRIQHDLQPFMRSMVATWMAEVRVCLSYRYVNASNVHAYVCLGIVMASIM